MLAGIGLGVDLNRFLTAREALAARAEGAALAAVLELDGTAAGVERARLRAASAWGTGGISGGAETMTLEFADAGAGPWKMDPLGVVELRAARVRATAAMPLTILRSVVDQKSLPVQVTARAEQQAMEVVNAGLLPWALDAGRVARRGSVVTLSPGAITLDPAPESEPRKQQPVRSAILAGLPFEVRIGQRLGAFSDPTPKVTLETLREVVASDTDSVSATYAEYAASGRGNGRRVVLLPLVDGERGVTAFGGFLLLPLTDNGGAVKVESIGSYLQGSRLPAAAAEGAWRAEVVTQ